VGHLRRRGAVRCATISAAAQTFVAKAGGNVYGYRVVKKFDVRGEPIRGDREIIEEQAEVIRRVFRDYVAGKGARKIAADLNCDGILSPRDLMDAPSAALPGRPRQHLPDRGGTAGRLLIQA
jgi:hypothetical protein